MTSFSTESNIVQFSTLLLGCFQKSDFTPERLHADAIEAKPGDAAVFLLLCEIDCFKARDSVEE